ncbi:GTP 3',8-cyclase MoaA [Paenibacillus spiritus]|uniref:GTP 3',8-cyclase n=1 Tax=Paenibacillus spiritus TaxID=2496557 RepID=A0A5J5FX38_9BACL|nr:GTP 3',8-cyclase MoaA [Paenibacillus spiritus]KAA8998379.1 GTP 3',8-cyclase MoaA [Paenibacillus spiritus]
MDALTDSFGRVHDYMRISVTDRCNLRCIYCMPAEGMTFQPSEQIMNDDEIAAVVRALVPAGLRKIRLTGGEPLVRPGLERLVAMLAGIDSGLELSLTTNGLLLPGKAAALKEAGLARVNISLDSLRPDRFARITRGGDVARVLKGIEAAQAAGLAPIKLNVVLMKGINDDEIADFISLTLDRPLHVRFIEYMPIGEASDAWRQTYLPLERVAQACRDAGWAAEAAEAPAGGGPSQDLRVPGAAGTFGLIHPVSEHFCEGCNRLRLTADGHIKACLYWSDEYHVRPLASDPEAVRALFRTALAGKPLSHEMALALAGKDQSRTPTARRMSQIGG